MTVDEEVAALRRGAAGMRDRAAAIGDQLARWKSMGFGNPPSSPRKPTGGPEIPLRPTTPPPSDSLARARQRFELREYLERQQQRIDQETAQQAAEQRREKISQTALSNIMR